MKPFLPRVTINAFNCSSNIPNGTWPEERLIDGAVGAIEDPSNFTNVEDGSESALDFDSAIPLIYPQGTVLFQEDDQWYESHGGYNGFWNSMSPKLAQKVLVNATHNMSLSLTARFLQLSLTP